jgi:hypothetical protein
MTPAIVRRAACRSPRQATNASRRPAADRAPRAAMAYRGRCFHAGHKHMA